MSFSNDCLTAVAGFSSAIANSCTQLYDPLSTNWASDPAALLDKTCSSECSNAITQYASNLNSTCGDQPDVNGQKEAAYSIISQYDLTRAIQCAKDADGSYCSVGQYQVLSANSLNSSSVNFFTNLVAYAQKNQTFSCSYCARNQIAMAKKSAFLYENLASQVNDFADAQDAICASQDTAAKNHASSLFSGSILSFAPIFFL